MKCWLSELFFNRDLLHSHFTIIMQVLMTMRDKAFENFVGKGGNAFNQHFLLFLHTFYIFMKETHNLNNIQFVTCLIKYSLLTHAVIKCNSVLYH